MGLVITLKGQNIFIEFNKVLGIVGIIAISIVMFNINGVYAKSKTLDYFIIENAYDDIFYTCAYGDYIYILNNTKLQKISLETSLVEDEIEWSLLSAVTEFQRKGERIYFDAVIDASSTIVCIDIESFTMIANVTKSKITPNWLMGLENIEYYDCNGNDFWCWAYSYASSGAGSKYPNIMKGLYDGGSKQWEWSMLFGHTYIGTAYGVTHYARHYRYNTTSDTVDYTDFNLGVTQDHTSYYYYASIFYDYDSNTWNGSASGDREIYYLGGSQLQANWDNNMNLQHYFNDQGYNRTSATWGDWGVRISPSIQYISSTVIINNKGELFLDTNDRVMYYYWLRSSIGGKGFRIARFDYAIGFQTWYSVYFQNNTNADSQAWGVMALGRYNDNVGDKRSWVGYVNATDKFPKAEYVIEVGGVTTLEAGTIEHEGYVPTNSVVYSADKNLIAIFRNGTNTDNLYVCRNLIDRGLIESNGYTTPTLQYIDATLYTMVGNNRVVNDGWLFMGEIYQLESTIQNMTYYYLELDDDENTLRFYFNNETKSLNITESEQFLGGLIDSSIETLNETLGKYTCTWTFILNRNIVDIQGLSITYYGYNELEEHYISDLAITGLSIYNLGGLTYYEFVGDGGHTAQGTPFELYATNGSLSSSAKAEQIFRKLQSVHFLMELDMDNEWDFTNGLYDIDAGVGYVDIGLDYRLDGSWVDGFKIRLYVQDADVGHHNLGVDNNWIEWSADFYNYNPSSGYVINLQSQLIYSNHWGYEHEDFTPDYHNRTSAQLWIDLWFDRTNASTTIATQVNSYYHGMTEQGSSWWFGYGSFQPMISDYDNAKFLDDLYDENGEISNCQKIELVKFWIEVGKVNDADGNDEKWKIRSIEDMNREQAVDRMVGIDEPTFVQTKVLDMPQGGFINAIKSAINNLSVTIWMGALQFIKILMSSIGYLMNAIGLGVWWESFSMMLSNIATASLAFMDELQTALINSALLLEQIFRMISNGIVRYTYAITHFISSIILWYQYIVQMFTGGGIFNIDIWLSLNLEDVFILLMHLFPVWWLNRLNESDQFFTTLQGDISFFVMLITGLFNFLSTVIVLTMTLINIILGMLPI